jgi:hypothetical protein
VTVRELDDVNAVPAQFLGEALPEYKILVHQEAQRIGGSRGFRIDRDNVLNGGLIGPDAEATRRCETTADCPHSPKRVKGRLRTPSRIP